MVFGVLKAESWMLVKQLFVSLSFFLLALARYVWSFEKRGHAAHAKACTNTNTMITF